MNIKIKTEVIFYVSAGDVSDPQSNFRKEKNRHCIDTIFVDLFNKKSVSKAVRKFSKHINKERAIQIECLKEIKKNLKHRNKTYSENQ